MTQSWRDRMREHSDRINFLPVRDVMCQTATEIKLPCLMAICGSVCVILKVEVLSCYVYQCSVNVLFIFCFGIILCLLSFVFCVFSLFVLCLCSLTILSMFCADQGGRHVCIHRPSTTMWSVLSRASNRLPRQEGIKDFFQFDWISR